MCALSPHPLDVLTKGRERDEHSKGNTLIKETPAYRGYAFVLRWRQHADTDDQLLRHCHRQLLTDLQQKLVPSIYLILYVTRSRDSTTT